VRQWRFTNSFLPPRLAIDDIRARIKSIGDLRSVKDGTNMLVKSQLESELSRAGGRTQEQTINRDGPAGGDGLPSRKTRQHPWRLHSAYQQLEAHYPKAEKREDNLFNLVRTSSLVAAARNPELRGNLRQDLPGVEIRPAGQPHDAFRPLHRWRV
jgi:hypothetical protein